jgi:hypothetical protein
MLEAGLSLDELALVYYNTNLQGFHSHVLTNLQPETVYWYRLTSYNPDGNGQSFANSFITQPTNRLPIAYSQTIRTVEDYPWDIELTATNGAPWEYYESLTYRVVTPPAHGTLYEYCSGCQWVRYTPNLNWFGTDSFTFVANDGEDDSQMATVSIMVDPVNDGPVVTNRTAVTMEDTAPTSRGTC